MALALAFVVCLVASTWVATTVSSVGTGPSDGASQSGLATAAITPGNSAATSCIDVETCTTPAIANVEAGDALVVIVTEHTTTNGNPSSVVEVTSGGDNALTLLGSSGCTVLGHGVVAVYGLADVAAQTSVTFTADYAEDAYYTVHAIDLHGAAAAPFETAGAPVCSTAAGTEASASVTTTVDNDLAILGVEVRGDEAIAATGGDSVVTLEEIGGADSDSGSMLDEFDAGTGSITLSATFTSAQYAALAIAVKPAASTLVPGEVSPATAAIDAGQDIGLTSTAASGGSGSYAYQWYTGSATCGSGTAITGATSLTYTTPDLAVGTDYYCVEDTDTSTLATAYTNVAVITVNPALSAVVTPAGPSIDQGQSVTLTADVTGGTGTDSFLWYADGTCTGTVIGTSDTLSTGALAADQTYCVAVTDSSYTPVTVTATDTVTVSAEPVSVTILPSSPSVDPGQSVNLTAEPSGGTEPYAYAWYAGLVCGVGSVLATTQEFETPALGSSTSFCVSVTDSSYEPQSATASVTIVVSTSSVSVSIDPAAPSIDLGQTVELTATAVGGIGPYSYVWYEYEGSCSGSVLADTQEMTTPALSTTTEYCVVATDSSYEPESAVALVTVTVSSAALSVVITPASPAIDLGQSVELTATPSGGTGADSYQWFTGASCSGTPIGLSATLETPALATTTVYCVAVTDSAYVPVTASATDTVTVSSLTLSVTITPASPSIDLGQSIQLTAAPSGGTAPYSYLWYAGLVCTGSSIGDLSTLTTSALDADASYCVAVTDSSYEPLTALSNDSITVSASVLSVAITPNNPTVDPDQSVVLTAEPSGGVSPYGYDWYSGSSCSGSAVGASQSFTTPALTATTTYCVVVVDSSYEPVSADALDVVSVSGTALTVSISPSAPAIDLGQSIALTAEPDGGVAPYAYSWYTGASCAGTALSTAQTFTTPALSATTEYCVSVTDSSSVPATATAVDTVTVSGSALSVSITPINPRIDPGQSIQLTANPSGGTAPDSYAWFAGSACSGTVLGTGQTYTTGKLAASSTYCVAATDSAYSPSTATATNTVSTSSSDLSVTITPASPSVSSGHAVTLTAMPLGGMAPYSYSWYAGSACSGSVLGAGKNFTSPALTNGTEYCVAVTDSSATPATATALAAVAVTTASHSGSGSTGLTSFLGWAWWLLLLLVVVILFLFFVVGRRRKKKEEPGETGPGAGLSTPASPPQPSGTTSDSPHAASPAPVSPDIVAADAAAPAVLGAGVAVGTAATPAEPLSSPPESAPAPAAEPVSDASPPAPSGADPAAQPLASEPAPVPSPEAPASEAAPSPLPAADAATPSPETAESAPLAPDSVALTPAASSPVEPTNPAAESPTPESSDPSDPSGPVSPARRAVLGGWLFKTGTSENDFRE